MQVSSATARLVPIAVTARIERKKDIHRTLVRIVEFMTNPLNT